MELPVILALDPGGKTGWCLFDPDSAHTTPLRDELRTENHHVALYDLLHMVASRTHREEKQLAIVCERFEFRRDDRSRDKIEYISGEYVGVVQVLCQQAKRTGLNVELVMQSASQIKAAKKEGPQPFWGDDDKLKKLALWVPGQPHAMDATRHYLYYRSFTLGDNTLIKGLR